jgi:hypothetical protein
MSFSSWIKRRTSNHAPRGRRSQPLVRRWRPQLEALEDRWLPSPLTVTNTSGSSMATGSLPYWVNYADNHGGGTINFGPSVTGTINLNSPLLITANMEIDGPGMARLTISGQNKTEVFCVSSPFASAPIVATINDLTIANGSASIGGGLYEQSAALNLSRDTLANNLAFGQGGAVYTAGGTVTVMDSVFSGNRVVVPAFSQILGAGGAIFSVFGTLTVSGTTFTSNMVLGANGALGFANSNVGHAAGGAVFSEGDTLDTFTGDAFTANSARGGIGDAKGSGNYTIGQGQGGAIDAAGSVVEIDLSQFYYNYAQGGPGADVSGGGRIGLALGGAIEVETGAGVTNVTVNDSTFYKNRALGANFGTGVAGSSTNVGAGGAINAEGADTFLSVAGGNFYYNTARGGVSGFVTSNGGRFGSAGVGGAINLGGGASGDISGTFTGNMAFGGNGTGNGTGGNAFGGAISAFPTQVTITSSQFNNNLAHGGMGGPWGGSAACPGAAAWPLVVAT